MSDTDKLARGGDASLDLIKRTVCKGATDDELKLFLHTAGRMGLDPLSGQIHGLKRWDSKERRDVMKIQVGIDGFRLVADRTGERDGEDDPEWCGEDGQWTTFWPPSKGNPVAARVRVYRKGHSRGYTGIAYWDFYVQKKRDGNVNKMWGSGGPHMLAKCAEALALRKAFPAELSGVYTSDEMAQASSDGVVEAEHEPVRNALPTGDAGDFEITFGKNAGKRLRELSERQLSWYAEKASDEDVRAAASAWLEQRSGAATADVAGQLNAERDEAPPPPEDLFGDDNVPF